MKAELKEQRNDPKSLAMNVSSMLIFGTIGVLRRHIPLSSAFIAFVRGMLGGLTILAFMKVKGIKVREDLSRRQVLWLALTGAVMGINWILLFEAFNHTTVAIATLCYYMQPTIVILLSPVLFREKLSAKKLLCAAVAIAGMILVSGIINGNPQSGSFTGVLLGLGAAVLYAAVIIMNKSKIVCSVNAYRKTMIQLLSAGAVMIPYLILSGTGIDSNALTPKTILLLLTAGILHTGIAYLLYFGSMSGIRVQSIAILSYIDPVSALFFSALFLKEPLSPAGIIGAVMIIGSAVIAEYEPGRFMGSRS
jgi:RarD protein